jgi:hypothetical protein
MIIKDDGMKHVLIFGLFCAASSIQAMHTGDKPDSTIVELRLRNGGGQDAHRDYPREILPVPGTIKDLTLEKSEAQLNRLMYVGAALGFALTAFTMYGIQ